MCRRKKSVLVCFLSYFQALMSYQGRDETLLCPLSNFDAYYVTRSHRSPKPFAFTMKSTDNLSFFENTADYMHNFSCSEKNGQVWVEKILVARVRFRCLYWFLLFSNAISLSSLTFYTKNEIFFSTLETLALPEAVLYLSLVPAPRKQPYQDQLNNHLSICPQVVYSNQDPCFPSKKNDRSSCNFFFFFFDSCRQIQTFLFILQIIRCISPRPCLYLRKHQ